MARPLTAERKEIAMDSKSGSLAAFLNSITSNGQDSEAVALVAEFTQASPTTVHRWRREKYYPNGLMLCSLVCLSELLETPFQKETLPPLARSFREFIIFRIETIDEVEKMVGIRAESLIRFIRGGAGVSATVAIDLRAFQEIHQDQLDETKALWKERFAATVASMGIKSQTADSSESPGGARSRRGSDSTTLTAIGHQIQALNVLLSTFLGESTPEMKKALRQNAGHETISTLRGHLQQLNLSDESYADQPKPSTR